MRKKQTNPYNKKEFQAVLEAGFETFRDTYAAAFLIANVSLIHFNLLALKPTTQKNENFF